MNQQPDFVLCHEDQLESNQLLAAYLQEFQPQTESERFLVETMVAARWRMARMQRLETTLLEKMIAESTEGSADLCLLAGLAGKTAAILTTLQRNIAAAERAYYKAHRELLQTRRAAAKYDSAALNLHIKRLAHAPLPPATLPTPPPRQTANSPQLAPPPNATPSTTDQGNPALRL